MGTPAPVQEAINAAYAGLSGKLRVAADHIVAHPFDLSTRSLRAVASGSGVSTATLYRLAHALGYDSYREMRDVSRADLERRTVTFSDKARQLQSDAEATGMAPLLRRHSAACVANIEELARHLDLGQVEEAVDCIAGARRVFLISALGSAGFGEYLAYLAGWFCDHWILVGRNGVSPGAAMAHLQPEDAVIVISKAPYARTGLRACNAATESGASLIIMTDSRVFPGLAHARHRFIVPSDGTNFFPSYAATAVLIEILIGMLVARAGAEAESRIGAVSAQNHRLEEFWAP